MIYILCALFFLLFVLFFFISYKAIQLNRMYEDFYDSSVEEISIIMETINAIVDRRPLLVDDPDIQHLLKGLRLAQDVMRDYVTVKNPSEEREEN